jgi:hypothetical protein
MLPGKLSDGSRPFASQRVQFPILLCSFAAGKLIRADGAVPALATGLAESNHGELFLLGEFQKISEVLRTACQIKLDFSIPILADGDDSLDGVLSSRRVFQVKIESRRVPRRSKDSLMIPSGRFSDSSARTRLAKESETRNPRSRAAFISQDRIPDSFFLTRGNSLDSSRIGKRDA